MSQFENKLSLKDRVDELSVGLSSLLLTADALKAEVQQSENQSSVTGSSGTLISQVWFSTSLRMRIEIVRVLLPDSNSLQQSLKQAAALEELRARDNSLVSWLTDYPSLFADSWLSLTSNSCSCVSFMSDCKSECILQTVDNLAIQVLTETIDELQSSLSLAGLEWIAPAIGDVLTNEMEAVCEEASVGPKNTVARLIRSGFKLQNKMFLPAQVVRSTGFSAQINEDIFENIAVDDASSNSSNEQQYVSEMAVEPERTECIVEAMEALDPSAADVITPEWYRLIAQRLHACTEPAAAAVLEKFLRLVTVVNGTLLTDASAEDLNTRLIQTIEPLLPVLTMRYADALPGVSQEWGIAFLDERDAILQWLNEILGLTLINPNRGETFDDLTMVAAESRRTAHANEFNSVARVEVSGVCYHQFPLIKSRVIRYIAGGE